MESFGWHGILRFDRKKPNRIKSATAAHKIDDPLFSDVHLCVYIFACGWKNGFIPI